MGKTPVRRTILSLKRPACYLALSPISMTANMLAAAPPRYERRQCSQCRSALGKARSRQMPARWQRTSVSLAIGLVGKPEVKVGRSWPSAGDDGSRDAFLLPSATLQTLVRCITCFEPRINPGTRGRNGCYLASFPHHQDAQTGFCLCMHP